MILGSPWRMVKAGNRIGSFGVPVPLDLTGVPGYPAAVRRAASLL